jgi:hypothetical protein
MEQHQATGVANSRQPARQPSATGRRSRVRHGWRPQGTVQAGVSHDAASCPCRTADPSARPRRTGLPAFRAFRASGLPGFPGLRDFVLAGRLTSRRRVPCPLPPVDLPEVTTGVQGHPFRFQPGWGDPYCFQPGWFALADPVSDPPGHLWLRLRPGRQEEGDTEGGVCCAFALLAVIVGVCLCYQQFHRSLTGDMPVLQRFVSVL